MSAAAGSLALASQTETVPPIVDRAVAAFALGLVRDGVITGEGPTTHGRVHFSRSLDAEDAAWCERILLADPVIDQPVSRAEAEALFRINDAGAERSDDGRFDDLFAKAVAHHIAAASGIAVPSRRVALDAQTAIESWAPSDASRIDRDVLDWFSGQMRAKRRPNALLTAIAATLIGAALPLTQNLPNFIDLGM
ncbi:MAG TPA: hypothetical protein VNZ94_02195 [Xanthobacteraceae bacterium]|nr:hypothetical protein [Xanthobacteraceae bacterium]